MKNEMYKSIFENAVEGIFQSTPDSRLIVVNPAMARIFGYHSPDEMIKEINNIGHQLYINTGDRHKFQQLLEKHGVVEDFESKFYKKDGSTLWGSLNVRAVKDETGSVLYYEGTLEDITSRKNAEEELKRSEEKYRNIFDNTVEGIFQITPEGKYLSANPALAMIHGYNSPEEMILSVKDIASQLYVDPSRRDELKRLTEEKGFVKNFEIMMRRKDASLQWVSVNNRAVRNAEGKVLYYEGTLQDITARKFSEEELKQLKKTLDGIIEAMSLMVDMHDPGTSGHQKKVSRLAGAIARETGLINDTIARIEMAGIIHDTGKIAVPSEILSKPAELTDMEHSFIKIHPQSGYDIFKKAGLPYPVAEIILQHHERLDGSGYPKGLKGVEIPLEARILTVADVVEAMTYKRPYRPALGINVALDEIKKNRGILYDSGVVDTCIKLFKQGAFKFE